VCEPIARRVVDHGLLRRLRISLAPHESLDILGPPAVPPRF
jgi:hypothetical protein